VIYTSYFAKIRALPDNIVPISIALKPPAGYNGLQYNALAPSPSILYNWKQDHNENEYAIRYREEILSRLTPKQVIADLNELANGKDIALICYEKPSDFCHRHLVAEWLTSNGFCCKEWTNAAPVNINMTGQFTKCSITKDVFTYCTGTSEVINNDNNR
jgi:uncharacterized protein YeaO (DUF488 family)